MFLCLFSKVQSIYSLCSGDFCKKLLISRLCKNFFNLVVIFKGQIIKTDYVREVWIVISVGMLYISLFSNVQQRFVQFNVYRLFLENKIYLVAYYS